MVTRLTVVLLVLACFVIPVTAQERVFLPEIGSGPSGRDIWNSSTWQQSVIVTPGVSFKSNFDRHASDMLLQRISPAIASEGNKEPAVRLRDVRISLDAAGVCDEPLISCVATLVLQIRSSADVNDADVAPETKASTRVTWLGSNGKAFDCYLQALATDESFGQIWQKKERSWIALGPGTAADACESSFIVAMGVMQTQPIFGGEK